ncbi:LolA-like protein [Halosimplex sp. J119]
MRRPALHLAVAVCLVLAGCSLLGPDHTRDDRAESALADARDAMNETDTYRFDGDLSVVATADGRTERVDVRVNGTVDATERRIHGFSERDGEVFESYLHNRTRYQECGTMTGLWGVDEREADDWSTLTPAARQLALLESGSLSYNGTETLDGEEATLLVGEPTSEALTQYQKRRSRSLFGGPNVENAEVRVWLDEETDRLRKTHFQFEVSGNGNTATASTTMRFTDYGADVDVDVPVIPENKQWPECPG